MAEDKGQRAADQFAPEVGDEEGEADVLFQAQMGIYNFFTGNWKLLLGLLGLGLVGVFIFSMTDTHLTNQQREMQAEIYEIDRRMPQPDPLSAYGLAPADDPEDATRIANLKEGARRYEAVAASGRGTASVMALLRAGEAWARAGDTDAQLAALEKAHALGAPGVLGWSAAAQLAAIYVVSCNAAAAAAIYTQYSAQDSLIGQQALLELGLLQEASGTPEEAKKTLQDFTTRYPKSALLALAAEALGRLEG